MYIYDNMKSRFIPGNIHSFPETMWRALYATLILRICLISVSFKGLQPAAMLLQLYASALWALALLRQSASALRTRALGAQAREPVASAGGLAIDGRIVLKILTIKDVGESHRYNLELVVIRMIEFLNNLFRFF